MLETRKVYVDREGMALLECPYCRSSRIVDVAKFRNRETPLKVTCICRKSFSVSFEWRGDHREETYVDGYYTKLPGLGGWSRMLVKDVSPSGIGFTTLTTHSLKEGDKVKVKFSKGSGPASEVEKTAVVRRMGKGSYVGCEFADST